MKHFILLLCITIITATCFGQKEKRTLKTVTFDGEGYQLGFQHGKHFQKEIADILAVWKRSLIGKGDKTADELISDFLAYAKFDEAIKKWTPELNDEIKGIADGSGQSFKDLLALNLMDEFWVYDFDSKNHHCTGVGVPSINGQPAYVAQNMDLKAYTDKFQVLMRLSRTKNRPEQLILTHPGLLSLNGLNENGIGVCVNTLIRLKSSSSGLPVSFMIRKILNTTDPEDILSFIQNVPHASGQNYIIGIKDQIYDFEASANKVVRYDPKNKNGTIFHANEPIVNDDVKKINLEGPEVDRALEMMALDSQLRHDALSNRMKSNFAIKDTIIKEGLSSKDNKYSPVCRTNNGRGFTFASTIMTLTGKPNIQVTPGPPDESEYQTFYFNQK
ncbi:hypothetical protein GZ212_13165 [Mangrovimonas sp. CR14]|uniref:C45 family autoproteolytic acyltransferase/hydolase n=1 Tax=Mangrovimonas sp. CR14 TaxID=2706120 RepID=UPI001422B65B|nr:C45 family peptidase [Mangrovimonas sp. CR14]NIK93107.1 hypothetical protein [Mangrovimonas sp. CR14]